MARKHQHHNNFLITFFDDFCEFIKYFFSKIVLLFVSIFDTFSSFYKNSSNKDKIEDDQNKDQQEETSSEQKQKKTTLEMANFYRKKQKKQIDNDDLSKSQNRNTNYSPNFSETENLNTETNKNTVSQIKSNSSRRNNDEPLNNMQNNFKQSNQEDHQMNRQENHLSNNHSQDKKYSQNNNNPLANNPSDHNSNNYNISQPINTRDRNINIRRKHKHNTNQNSVEDNHNYQSKQANINFNDHQHKPLSPEDKNRQKIGRETMQVVKTGKYTIITNRRKSKPEVIDIKDQIDYCIMHTKTIKPNYDYSSISIQENSPMCTIDVTTETSFAAARRLKMKPKTNSEPKLRICVLNFASATQPGGGFLNGRGAQEETLCRQSALYASISQQTEMYDYNKANNDPYYSDYMIYSPNCPFFRDDDYYFIRSFRASVITSPAVNYSELRKTNEFDFNSVEEKIYQIMKERCRKILELCINEGNNAIILGAFGCGVFKNPPEMVSKIFKELLIDSDYGRRLKHVVFPIYSKDGSKGINYNVFKKQFANLRLK